MQVKTQQFQKAASRALANDQIQRALARVSEGFDGARQRAIKELSTEVWERYRERGRQVKEHTIEHLDYYLGQLTDNVQRNGGFVHFARDSKEATNIVIDIARSRGVKLVVKSKSMVSEEMALNHALEAQGIESVETDLGEYIIQLADETPFHLVAPATHKSKEEVAQLFSEKLGVRRLNSISALTKEARRTLRPKFLEADMGITGVNFAVAETGTIAIFTNEGNGGLSTSLPRVHVAIMGMEKVVPALEDLAVMLRLLPRAATGQHITSYVTLVSGPRRRTDEDGPEQFHLLIMDNGRSKLLADPELRESLYCIRCGACLNTCPVYQKVGGHAYGWVYPGPIGAVITPVMVGLPKAKDIPFASTLCGACRDACPLKINIPRMLLKLRRDLTEGDPGQRNVSRLDRLLVSVWRRTLASPRSLARVRQLAVFFQRPLVRHGRLRRIPLPPFSKWARNRDFPGLARRSFHQVWEEDMKDKQS
jgi:L-lactate dehydrogenase complex protein LldF